MRLSLLLPLLLLACAAQRSAAHPVEAAPLQHPYVFTFDQFHLPLDDEESLAQGGLLLMAEARCTACHSAPTGWQQMLRQSPAPDLSEVGSRLDADQLWLFIRSPQHRKRGSLMPRLFDNTDTAPEEVEAITQYLLTLRKQAPTPQWPQGDAQQGKQLYHTLGCVACHEAATDYLPPAQPAGMELEKAGNASVPIALADAYDLHSLTAFLHSPLATRPSGRMPAQNLTAQEAVHVASYLHLGRKVEPAQERALLQIPPQTAERGAQLFVEKRCSTCHTSRPDELSRPAQPLEQLHAAAQTSCISTSAAGKQAHYDFNELQQKALTLALKKLQSQPQPLQTPAQELDWQLSRLNCYACHDRAGKGGPEDARAIYFAQAGTEALADMARFPPSLDHAGWKLTAHWLQHTLHGPAAAQRSYLNLRMPQYGQAQIEPLIALFQKLDVPASTLAEPPASKDTARGAALFQQHCAACHAAPARLPIAPLPQRVQRLRYSYFHTLLSQPERMPHGDAIRTTTAPALQSTEIEGLWHYLKAQP